MVLLLLDEDLRRALTMKESIEVLGNMYSSLDPEKVNMPSRMMVKTPQGRMMVMPVSLSGWRYMGLKIYTVFDKVRFILLLYDSTDGSLLAAMDADYLGQLRTGAVSALATSFMSRNDSRTAGIVGSGAQARTQLAGIFEVRKIESVRVFSPNHVNRRHFAEDMSKTLRVNVKAADSAKDAVEEADIIVTATPAKTPVISGEWLREGTHINAIGSTLPNLRELDDSVLRKVNLIVVDSLEQVTNESGDIAIPLASKIITSNEIHNIWDLVKGKVSRKNKQEITLFKSVGTALQDIAVAGRGYENAKVMGIGRGLGDILISRPAATRRV